MPSQADIDRLIDLYAPEELHPDLQPYVRETSQIGRVLHHPLLIHVMFSEPLHRLANRQYVSKKEAVAKALAAGDYHRIMWLYERPYRLDALLAHRDAMLAADADAFWVTFSALWRDCENVHESFNDWDGLWREPDAYRAMTLEERSALKAMPETITVWRGGFDASIVEGLSWSVSRERAEWYAHRFANGNDRTPVLARAVIRRDDVRAYLTGRNEEEIVALSEHLKDIETTHLA